MSIVKKKIKAQVKLQLPGGGATPAPPVGSTLGQHGVNLMDFCKKFNAASASRKGETVPVQIVIYQDKTFDFVFQHIRFFAQLPICYEKTFHLQEI